MKQGRQFALMAGHGAIFIWIVNATTGERPEFASGTLIVAGQVAVVALVGMTLAYLSTAAPTDRTSVTLELASGLLFLSVLALWIASVGFGVAFRFPFT